MYLVEANVVTYLVVF